MNMDSLRNCDPELADCLQAETRRQEENLEMVASESIQPSLALDLAGSIFNNKTAVGNPEKQRLMGSQYAQQLEYLAAERACEIFGAEHAIMTPYSGSVANYCAYASCLSFGDRVLAMNPEAGAHQSHGGVNNMSSRMYRFQYFGLHRDTLLLDYEEAERLIKKFCPKLVVVGSASYSRNIDYEHLAYIAHKNNALLFTDIAHFTGLIAAGVNPNPIPFADIVTASGTKTLCGPHTGFLMCKKELAESVDQSVYPRYVSSLHLQTIASLAFALKNSQTEDFKIMMRKVVENAKYLCSALQKRGFGILTGGTDCHMFIADLRSFGVDCIEFTKALEKVGITVNSKQIPYDTSGKVNGVRAGTTVLTQRGFGRAQMEEIADIWHMLARDTENSQIISDAKARVVRLAREYPLPVV